MKKQNHQKFKIEKQILLMIKDDLCIKTHSTPYKWVNDINGVSKKAAKSLESLTGISRLRFLYPDEFGNPWPDVEALYKNK